ncbi:unnamed protein product, partial [marine sediment metagenome]
AFGLQPQLLDRFRKRASARWIGRLGKLRVKFLKLPALTLQGLWLGLLLILGVGFHERRAWQPWRFLLWSRCTLGMRVRQRRRGERKGQDHGEDEEFVMHPL